MPKIEEKFEREARAARLIWARKDAGFTGPTAVAAATGIPVNNIKAHEAEGSECTHEITDFHRLMRVYLQRKKC